MPTLRACCWRRGPIRACAPRAASPRCRSRRRAAPRAQRWCSCCSGTARRTEANGMRQRGLLAGAALTLAAAGMAGGALAAELPIFDAHLHYSHDAWESVPPEKAIAILRKAGLKRALISSSGDDGQQRLHALAPDLVIPELRPYRSRGEIGSWFRDESVIPYLEERLKRFRYAG